MSIGTLLFLFLSVDIIQKNITESYKITEYDSVILREMLL